MQYSSTAGRSTVSPGCDDARVDKYK